MHKNLKDGSASHSTYHIYGCLRSFYLFIFFLSVTFDIVIYL